MAKSTSQVKKSSAGYLSRTTIALIATFIVVCAGTAITFTIQQHGAGALGLNTTPKKDLAADAEGWIGTGVGEVCKGKPRETIKYPCATFITRVLAESGYGDVPSDDNEDINASNQHDWLLKHGWKSQGTWDINNPPKPPPSYAGCIVYFINKNGDIHHVGIITNPRNPYQDPNRMWIIDASGLQGFVVNRPVDDQPLTDRYKKITIICPPGLPK